MAFNFNTGGDTGVMQSAMGAARIKADAQDQSGMNALAGQVTGWASDIQKEERRIALEQRAEKAGIAKEGRDVAAKDAERAKLVGYLEDETSPEAIKAKQTADESKAKISKYDAEAANSKQKKANTTTRKIGQLTDVDKNQIKRVERQLEMLDPKKDKKKIAEFNKIINAIESRANMSNEELQELADLESKGGGVSAEQSAVATKTAGEPAKVAVSEPKVEARGPSSADVARISRTYGNNQPISRQKIEEIYQAEQLEKAGVGKPTLNPRLINQGVMGSTLPIPTRLQ